MTATARPCTGDAASRPDRPSSVEAEPLGPGSLVGSFFHGFGGKFHAHQGCVLAEPVPGTYLVELFSFVTGASTEQRLVPVGEMVDWRFYDTAEWMNNAYNHGVFRLWERQRVEREQVEQRTESGPEPRPAPRLSCPFCGAERFEHCEDGERCDGYLDRIEEDQ